MPINRLCIEIATFIQNTSLYAYSRALNSYFWCKVHKQGNKVGRAIDLSRMSSYHELVSELESLFQMEGMLTDRDGPWRLLYTDEENDIMVVGDDPWE